MLADIYLMRSHSPTVLYRSERLLGFVLGTEAGGAPVTIAAMLAKLDLDPFQAARHLNCVAPAEAVRLLTRLLERAEIGGEVCSGPRDLARAALAFAGRAV